MLPPVVDTAWLAERAGEPDLVIADVRWQHGQPDYGRAGFETARVAKAVRLDLERDLSDLSDLSRGRHPLPRPLDLVAALARAGIGQGTLVVVYDDQAGSVAARLWWLLRWLGQEGACALLDGGLQAWLARGLPAESGPAAAAAPHPRPLAPMARADLAATMSEVEREAGRGLLVLDARAAERYHGQIEPIDRRAGHIPGAVSAPYAQNLTTDAVPRFRTPAQLRATYQGLGVDVARGDASRVVCYCGSGVTSCHDLVALELAGARGARLYPGSWSEWVARHPEAGQPPPAA